VDNYSVLEDGDFIYFDRISKGASYFGGATSGIGQVDFDEGSIGQHPVIHKADLGFLGYSIFQGISIGAGELSPV
jgi:hypothetical protein